jgi:hypothetical protein
LIKEGVTRTLRRARGEVEVEIDELARWVTGRDAPLPTVTEVGEDRGWMERRLPGAEAMCDIAPVSRNQLEGPVPVGGTSAFARVARRAFRS